MNTTAIRHLFLQALARLPASQRPARPIRRILLIRPDHLGDLLFMTPALHALRVAAPGVHLACLLGPWGEPVLAGNPDLDEIVACDFPWFDRRPKGAPWTPYRLLWREAARLRARRFDMAMIMRFDFWWGAALARLAGIPLRLGYDLPDVTPFLTSAVPYHRGRHEVEQNLTLVEAALTLLEPSSQPSPLAGEGAGAAWGGQAAPPSSQPSPLAGEGAGASHTGSAQPPTPAAEPAPVQGKRGARGMEAAPPSSQPSPLAGEGAGASAQDLRLRFTVAPEDAARADTLLAPLLIPGPRLTAPGSRLPAPGPLTPDPGSLPPGSLTPDPGSRPPARLFAIHVGAGAPVKLWPADRWAALGEALAQRHRAVIVLTGGPGEVELARSVAARLGVPHVNLAGQTSLGTLGAIFARCALALGADSGPLHLAVAVGAPTVHLFGPADPRLFGPWGDPTRQATVQAIFFEEPCHNRPCNRLDYRVADLPQHGCMATIEVDAVLRAAERVLATHDQP